MMIRKLLLVSILRRLPVFSVEIVLSDVLYALRFLCVYRHRQIYFQAWRQNCMTSVPGTMEASKLTYLRCIITMSCRDSIILRRCMTFFRETQCQFQSLWLRLQMLLITRLQEDRSMLLQVFMDHILIIPTSMA